MFGNKGIHIYDIQKNQFDNGKFNTVKFRVRESKGENIDKKLNEVKDDLNKQNYRITIKKEKKRDIKKNLKGFVGNPGAKVGIMIDPESGNKAIYKKVNNNKRHEFSKQFNQINHGYKTNK